MTLFIKLKNGQPFEHPITKENFVLVFPDVDLNNLPEWVAPFERTEKPVVGMFEVDEGFTYELADGVAKEVWHIRAMTAEEQEVKIESVRNDCLANIEWLKKYALENASTASTEQARVAWQFYFDELNAFVLTDPFNYQLPRGPRISASGEILSTTSSGSAPNVIG
jgi:hypothetical protein